MKIAGKCKKSPQNHKTVIENRQISSCVSDGLLLYIIKQKVITVSSSVNLFKLRKNLDLQIFLCYNKFIR